MIALFGLQIRSHFALDCKSNAAPGNSHLRSLLSISALHSLSPLSLSPLPDLHLALEADAEAVFYGAHDAV
jgi:hypothetical protein